MYVNKKNLQLNSIYNLKDIVANRVKNVGLRRRQRIPDFILLSIKQKWQNVSGKNEQKENRLEYLTQ